MTTKHTPGPWTMHHCFNDGAEVCAIAPVAWCGAASTYGASSTQRIDAAEARANARLIAAAPDLLEACEILTEAQRRADAGEHGGFGCYVDAVDKARAAIAKAKGEP